MRELYSFDLYSGIGKKAANTMLRGDVEQLQLCGLTNVNFLLLSSCVEQYFGENLPELFRDTRNINPTESNETFCNFLRSFGRVLVDVAPFGGM